MEFIETVVCIYCGVLNIGKPSITAKLMVVTPCCGFVIVPPRSYGYHGNCSQNRTIPIAYRFNLGLEGLTTLPVHTASYLPVFNLDLNSLT